MNYRADIDGLRAVAVVPVLLFHAGFNLFSGGFVGVDIFFVISGYLITSIILKDIDNEKFSFKQFWNRRIRRIFPILFVVLIITLISFGFVHPPQDFEHLSKSVFSQSLFSANIFYWTQMNYFSPASELFPLLHMWSLAVEEQFYFFFPFLLFFLSRFTKKIQFYSLIALGILSLVGSIIGTNHMPAASFYLLPFRAWELIAGALLAFNYFQNIKLIKGPKFNEALSIIGMLLISYGVFFFNKETVFPSYNALLPVLGTIFVIQSNKEHTTFIGKLLSHRYIVFVGLISYSLYLWHWPVLVFNKQINLTEPSLISQFLALGFSFIIAVITYKVIETPTRLNKDFFTTKKMNLFFIGGTVLLLLFSSFIIKTNGFEKRMGGSFVDFNKETKIYKESKSCADANNPICPLSSTAEYKVVVWGDSHAASLLPAVIKASKSVGNSDVAFAIKHACPSITGTKVRNNTASFSQKCFFHNSRVFKHILDNPPKVLFIVNRYNNYLNHRDEFDKKTKSTRFISNYNDEDSNDSSDSVKAIKKQLTLMSSKLNEKGITHYFVKQVPNFNIHAPNYANKLQAIRSNRVFYKRPVAEILKRSKSFNQISKDLNLPTIDLSSIFCDEQSCYPFDNSKSLYFDDNHLSVYGAEKASGMFERFLNF